MAFLLLLSDTQIQDMLRLTGSCPWKGTGSLCSHNTLVADCVGFSTLNNLLKKFFFKDFIYVFMKDTQREAET